MVAILTTSKSLDPLMDTTSYQVGYTQAGPVNNGTTDGRSIISSGNGGINMSIEWQTPNEARELD